MNPVISALISTMRYGAKLGLWFYLLGSPHNMDTHSMSVAQPWLTLKTNWSRVYINPELRKSDNTDLDLRVNQAFLELYGRFDLKLGRIVHIPGFLELLNPLSHFGNGQISPMMSLKGDDGIWARTSSGNGEISLFVFRRKGHNWMRVLELKLYSDHVTAEFYAGDSVTAAMLAYYGAATLKLTFSSRNYGQSIYAVAEKQLAISQLTASFKLHILINKDGPMPQWIPFRENVIAAEATLGNLFDQLRALVVMPTEGDGYLTFLMLNSHMNWFDLVLGGSAVKLDSYPSLNTIFAGVRKDL
jgi:hypothetical protein